MKAMDHKYIERTAPYLFMKFNILNSGWSMSTFQINSMISNFNINESRNLESSPSQ